MLCYHESMSERNLPKVEAVDPTGCGCTECLIGEYLQEEFWYHRANRADVIALLRGEVRNNTYYPLARLLDPYYYTDEDVKEMLIQVREELYSVPFLDRAVSELQLG